MERTRTETTPRVVVAPTPSLAGFDCDAGVTVLCKLWTADVRGLPRDAQLLATWAGHTRGSCDRCTRMFRDLGVLARFGTTDEPGIQLSPQVRVTDRCLTMLQSLRPWAEAKILGADGTRFELEIGNHLCGCYGCREMFKIFGGELGLSFGNEKQA